MKRPVLTVLAAGLLLAGCLEVEQHPPWIEGAYDGKPDQLPMERYFHNDRMAWVATVIDRNWRQDEYGRTLHQGADYDD